ncbi:MAG: sigma-70 family RNA polymerase sigma factor [Chloroflexi bacterium]|nr:sigma-70 family RNA polymerase sigma factor [Chloroflexota bacterium]
MTDRDWLAERFEDHRPHLRGVAYRMLGSLAEAEDTVQDAWLRVTRAETRDIDNLGGWLTTIVARLALDRLRARAARPEEPLAADLPDPIVTAVDADPEGHAVLADSVGLALLIVLDTLTPAERLAFVLHDTFGVPFDQIAPIVERTPTATRKLASRARQRVRGAARGRGVRSSSEATRARQWAVVDAFVAAARDGDFEALLRVLDQEVAIRADGGVAGGVGSVAAPAGPGGGLQEVRGAAAVAGQALRFRQLAPGARRAIVNGAPGAVVFAGDRLFAVMAFEIRGDVIVEMDFVTRPERLARLGLNAEDWRAGPPG